MNAIRPRRVRFELGSVDPCWIPGDPQTTHTIDVLHLLLPAGERWFVRVFQEVLPHVPEGELREVVRGFMGQESTHSRAHDAVLERYASVGVNTEAFTRHIDWLFERMLDKRPFGLRVPRSLRRLWLHHRVALVAAIEHYTAFLGSWVIEHSQGLDAAGADPTMMALLRWHGAEEVEHRSVAFDAAKSLGVGWFHRAIAMIEVTVVLTWLWRMGTLYLMRADRSNRIKPTWRAFHVAARAGKLPTMRSLFAEIPRYFRFDYHPSQTGSLERALDVLA